MALESLNAIQKEHRRFASMTLGVSHKTYAAMWDKICEMREEFAKMAANDKEADRVYQLNFQLFPVSKIKGGIK